MVKVKRDVVQYHSDNRPENLVPLCPNHHEMLHSNKYGAEMETSLTRLLEGRGDS